MHSLDSPFFSRGTRCAGTLLLPERAQRPPVVVMAHGFGAIRAAGLQPFAERFVAAGYAVYLFDYRGFGDSEGEPRHWISPRRHLQDWSEAVRHVRGLPQVDAGRLVLWGYCFSGGHVIETAAADYGVGAVIAQSPHVCGIAATMRQPIARLWWLAGLALLDLVGSLFGRRHYSRIIGQPGERAAFNSPGAFEGYMSLLPQGAAWQNRALSRIFLALPLYSPFRSAPLVRAPALLLGGTRDDISPARVARAAAARMPRGEFELLDSDHFQHCFGELFEQSMARQLAFLQRNIPAV